MERRRKLYVSLALILPCLQWTTSFNLDIENPNVFSGPKGSYFGFSVDFFMPDNKSNILIGAPRANTSSASSVVERGAVYTCPWQQTDGCTQVLFDNTGEDYCDRTNDAGVQMEFKSNQWFGASVRSQGENILACAPLYQWSTYSYNEREPVGTCFFKKGEKVVEYSPCRSSKSPLPHQAPVSDCVSLFLCLSFQMAAYFGHSVAATDINKDGLIDLFVGAPLFMDLGGAQKQREVGQVSVFLGDGGFSFQPPLTLNGTEIYSRFGSSIAALGDLDMDGFNDVAIAAPYGGPKHQGLVYIHNGRATGPSLTPSQVLEGRWASSNMPPSFGYSLHGATDIDHNGYPGSLTNRVYVNATLDISPQILNPEDKSCKLPDSTPVSWLVTDLSDEVWTPARGAFQVDLVLDRLRPKGPNKRVLFLHSKTFQYSKNMTVSNGLGPTCEEQEAYLIVSEFRDKITPIVVLMEYKPDYQQAADKTGLLPILDLSVPTNISKQAHILLDCGEDNICKPDLRLSVVSDQKEMYIGDDNTLTMGVTVENLGEAAYEAELRVFLPPQADFSEVVSNSETTSKLSCAPERENQTTVVVCYLGNPMKGGTKVLAGLRFSVHKLSEQDTQVRFDLQIQSSNQFNNTSSLVSSITKLAVLAKVDIRGVSTPDQVFLPIANWQMKESPVVGDDIGPAIRHIYELRNHGPSTFSKALLDIEWPYQFNNGSLLYITKLEVDGMNCTTEMEINPLNVSISLSSEKNTTGNGEVDNTAGRGRNRRDLKKKEIEGDLETLDCSKAQCMKIRCLVGRVERGQSAILYIHSRLGVATFLKVRQHARFSSLGWRSRVGPVVRVDVPEDVSMAVIWVKSEPEPVPAWVVALAVLAGLLLLALLIFIMYKLGFFKRVRPPQDDSTEKEQLAPQESGDRNTDA
uniref:Integrin alpha-2 domain-containing protein n=1 Tax=Esox lucius TaxID=8010 RepID=A0A6Q2Y9U3_ESOLU